MSYNRSIRQKNSKITKKIKKKRKKERKKIKTLSIIKKSDFGKVYWLKSSDIYILFLY